MSGPRLSAIVPASDGPPTLARCVAAIEAAAAPPEEVLVVEEPRGIGPARARNAAAQRATGDVLVFVDADVVVRPDAFERIRAAFAADPGLVAVFGAYDDEPEAPGLVSRFRNLLHHHVHAGAAGPAETFWAGLGAVRADAFHAAGGFDGDGFHRPSIEDVELGARLRRAGGLIVLDPAIRGTHLKRWTLRSMLVTDVHRRGAPWVELALSGRVPAGVLNLGWRHRLSALASLAVAVSVVRRRPVPALAALGALVVLNRAFYGLLARRLGVHGAGVGVGLHALHHLSAVAAAAIGTTRWLARRLGAS